MGTLAPMPPLRGRQAEVAALDEALGRVASGRPAIVLIQGEAGIGKTRLLEEARRRGMQVAAGRAGELERTRPFGLVADAFGCARSAPDPRRAAIYDFEGPLLTAYILCAFGFAVLAGLLLRRSIPAMVAAFIPWLAIRLGVEYLLRPHFQAPLTFRQNCAHGSPAAPA